MAQLGIPLAHCAIYVCAPNLLLVEILVAIFSCPFKSEQSVGDYFSVLQHTKFISPTFLETKGWPKTFIYSYSIGHRGKEEPRPAWSWRAMKLSTIAKLLLLLVSALPGEAVFANPFVDSNGNPIEGGGSFTNPDFFDITNVLQCADDRGDRLNVNLAPPQSGSDFDYFLPEASGYGM